MASGNPNFFRSTNKALAESGFFLATDIWLTDFQLLAICQRLGTPVASTRHSELIRGIQPEPLARANPNTLSSRFGLGSFPFHTDGAHWRNPPRLVVLYCVNPGMGKRETILSNVSSARVTPAEKNTLMREVWRTTNTERSFLCQVLSEKKGNFRFRFDTACMAPRTPDHQSEEILLSLVDRVPRINIAWAKGTFLVVDNQRLLHARGESKSYDTDRLLKRVLLS